MKTEVKVAIMGADTPFGPALTVHNDVTGPLLMAFVRKKTGGIMAHIDRENIEASKIPVDTLIMTVGESLEKVAREGKISEEFVSLAKEVSLTLAKVMLEALAMALQKVEDEMSVPAHTPDKEAN